MARTEAEGVSEQEAHIVNLLGLVWNLYLELPREHPNEQAEFCAAVHACQEKVLARSGRRQMAPVKREGRAWAT